ncbi:hypothetical protein PINS_up009161 [Pythium insidiosum]|nr:hypothetical protein PINS_up009161 [Pythium insidiosum]
MYLMALSDAHLSQRFSVAIPVSESSRDHVTVLQLKTDAITQLRKMLGKDSTAVSPESKDWLMRQLNHDPDWFVLCIDDPCVWMKDELRPLSFYTAAVSARLVDVRLAPQNTMPHPTIELTITDTKRKISDLTQRPYTAYIIDVAFDNMTWQIQRRYQEFYCLHQQLKAKCSQLGVTLPQLPPKRVFTPLDGDFVLRRRVHLAQYLQSLIEHPVISQDVLLLSFLGVVSRSRDPEVNKSGKNVMHITAVHTGLDYGDIVLFSCRFGASVIQRKLTRSTYDHVGIVVPGPSRNLLRILEATGEGIQVYSLKTRLMAYSREVSKSIVVRKLVGPRNKETVELLNEFVKSVDGNSYSIFGILQARGESDRCVTSEVTLQKSIASSPAAASQTVVSCDSLVISPANSPARGASGEQSPSRNEKRKYFCSSLVASALKHIGWLDTTHSSSYFWPGSFEEGGEVEQYLAEGVSIGPETLIDCRIVEVGLATATQ